jgi:hypothetical protein
MRVLRAAAAPVALAGVLAAIQPPAASASICGPVGFVNGAAGKACNVVTHGDKLISAGKKLAGGHIGSAINTALGGGSGGGGPRASTAIGLAAIGAWVLGGAKAALHEMVKVIGETTTPRLTTTWFSATYWRMAGIAALLTLPFLFAAAVQALMRSDLSLLARSALGYLPLSLLAVGIAAPLAMLLLSACDEMSAIISSAAGHSGTRFLTHLGVTVGALSLLSHSPFLAFLVGLLIASGAIVLWVELLMREAAVYIVVLMLPLAFAAMVWPARRVWAVRATELLVALILSKFAIVAVLALGGAALGHEGISGAGAILTGLVLVTLGAFAPWALVRLLPLAELASGAAGHLRGELGRAYSQAGDSGAYAEEWASSVTARMQHHADDTALPAQAQADGARAEAEKLDAPNGEAATEAADGVLVGVGSSASPAGHNGDGPETQPDERRPGMAAQYQAANNEWSPIVFGPEGWSRDPVWPPECSDEPPGPRDDRPEPPRPRDDRPEPEQLPDDAPEPPRRPRGPEEPAA